MSAEPRRKLYTPGPVTPPREVVEAAARPPISHRSEEFHQLYTSVTEKLKKILNMGDGVVALLTGNGTLAVDAMCWSLVRPGEKVLLVSHGVFGDRMSETLRRRGAVVHVLKSPAPGEPVDPARVVEHLEDGGYTTLALVHNETSMGLAYRDLRELAREASRRGVKVLVDAVSSLAGEELDMSWGLTAVASASHKALAAPPGASFVALSRRALEELERGTSSGTPLAIDLKLYVDFDARRETPFTPPVTVLYALDKSLDRILRVGLQAYIEEHRRKAALLYTRLPDKGFKPVVARARYRSNTVAAFWTPEGVDAVELKKRLARKGYQIATGMKEYKNRMIRIGVMGDTSIEELEELVKTIAATTHQQH